MEAKKEEIKQETKKFKENKPKENKDTKPKENNETKDASKGSKAKPQTNEQGGETKKEGTGRRDHLRKIELEVQKYWEDNQSFSAYHVKDWESKMTVEEKNNSKFFVTFPYAYMNGLLHLGHAYSVSKAEFQARYQRLKGKNVLWSCAYHCTGMPIAAAANRIKAELEGRDDKKPGMKQSAILEQMGIPKEEIHKFADATHWIEYFPALGKEDFRSLGLSIDYTRGFTTTERQKFYDKFIQWQFLKLRQEGKIKFGKRQTIFSIRDNQACADHDRSAGEGVGPQEYTLIKLQLLECKNEKMQELLTSGTKKVYLPAATLRPETMYGQTNCFVLPEGDYGVFEMKNDEIFICSQQSAINMSYQGMTKEDRVHTALFKIKGKELIGCPIKAPMTKFERVFVLPMLTVSIEKGTGVVTSVPSDAPDDWACLRDCQKDEKLRKDYGLTDEMTNFSPVPIIDIPEFGNLAAVTLVEEMKIKNHQDKVNLALAKDKVYLKGFTAGTMLVGEFAGKKVSEAKVLVKNSMINDNNALIYYEPEQKVVSRSGDVCIVANIDQWYLTYGEESWKKPLVEFINNEFKTYNNGTLNAFKEKIEWFKEWGCSRTFGNGSRIPWDTQYLIESLSDSTIYMSFYTIYNYMADDIFGDKPKPGMDPEFFTEEVFDFIFLKKELISESKIPKEILKEMRDSFHYWYPQDLRCSGKDLISNHLIMTMYNHYGIWKTKDMLPRAYFTNGLVLVDGEKMSKSLGNFLTVRQIVEEYGVDSSRLTLADCGDTLDDANFVREIAKASVSKLFNFEKWLEIIFFDKLENTYINDLKTLNVVTELKIDQIFDNNINYLIEQTRVAYEAMKYKDVLKSGFHEFMNIKDDYFNFFDKNASKMNKALIVKYLRCFFIVINPIIPHWTEYLYKKYLNPIFEKLDSKANICTGSLSFMKFPDYHTSINMVLFKVDKYVKKVMRKTLDTVDKFKGKKGNPEPTKAKYIIAENYQEFQIKVFNVLKNCQFDDQNKINDDFKTKIIKGMGLSEKENKKEMSNCLQFASYIIKEVEKYGSEALEHKLVFNENDCLKEYHAFLLHMTKLKEIEIVIGKEAKELADSNPGNPSIVIS